MLLLVFLGGKVACKWWYFGHSRRNKFSSFFSWAFVVLNGVCSGPCQFGGLTNFTSPFLPFSFLDFCYHLFFYFVFASSAFLLILFLRIYCSLIYFFISFIVFTCNLHVAISSTCLPRLYCCSLLIFCFFIIFVCSNLTFFASLLFLRVSSYLLIICSWSTWISAHQNMHQQFFW